MLTNSMKLNVIKVSNRINYEWKMNNPGKFGRHQRKIMPKVEAWKIPEHPGNNAEYEELVEYARAKAGALNQHLIGYGELAENEWKEKGIKEPDLKTMRQYRLNRIRQQLKDNDLAAIHLYDPLNIRYAIDTTNMQLWTAHNPVRCLFIATEGPIILFEFHNCEHLSDHTGLVDEVRPCTAWFYFESGTRCFEFAEKWADDVAELVREHGGGNMRCAFDQVDAHGIPFLEKNNIEVIYGEDIMEEARKIKSDDEILCMKRAITSCQAAMWEMEKNLKPGMTENDLWAILHAENIRRGGEWIETRLLSSGPRTNPWMQECSAKVIQDGELVSYDTDLIGPYGFCCDISRTHLAGDGKPTNEQRTLYQMAVEQIEHNREILKPGMSFNEIAHKAQQLPEEFMPTRYSVLYHGVGLCDEYPAIRYEKDQVHHGNDGILEIGMTVCVESYIGRHGGNEGVKMEDQGVITENGFLQLSDYHLDERLMGK